MLARARDDCQFAHNSDLILTETTNMYDFALTKHPSMVIAPGSSIYTGQHVTDTTGANSRVLLVCDSALRSLGLVDGVESSIRESGHMVSVFDDLQSDPKEASVNAAIKIAKEMDANCIVGLGGGSALDTSKVVAALAHDGENCEPYRLSNKPFGFRKTGLIALPTTAGTGSETTGTSIISQADGIKNWFWGPALKPDMALMDPELTVGLPAFWTFYTGMDAIVHSIESRTNRYRYAQNDGLAELGIRHGIANLEQAVLEPDSIEARSGMMLAAAYGGLAIGNTGCAVAHNIGHALGSIAQVPHGRAVSVALVQTMDWAIEGNREAFDAVGSIMHKKGAGQVADHLHAIAEKCNETLALNADEKSRVEEAVLAKDMVAEANIAMLDATARDAGQGDVEELAAKVLAA